MFVIADLHEGKYPPSVLGNILAVKEREKLERKLRDHISQRKARKLQITRNDLIIFDWMIYLL